MDWGKILEISFSKNLSLDVEFGIFFFVLVGIALIGFLVVRFFKGKNSYGDDIELNINLGGIGMVTIRKNYEVIQTAHRAWVELATRKAGLSFDPDNDVIVEIYDSWYVLFDRMRELIKAIPVQQMGNGNTKALVDLLVNSLNKGLRPHLTKWQARFRRWYEAELAKEENKGKSPQEIQKEFLQYDGLVRDLILINQQIVAYTNELKRLQ